jgi:hypothetical protein
MSSTAVPRNTKNNQKNHHLKVKSIHEEPNITWIIYGVFYIALVFGLSYPPLVTYLPVGSMSTILITVPLWGVALMLRDMVQYTYEDTPEKRQKSSGFWPSMGFIIVGAIINGIYADPSIKVAVIVSCLGSSMVDGIIFSRSHHRSLTFRLFYSNVIASVCNAFLFVMSMRLTGHFTFNMFHMTFGTFMEISPALLFFVLHLAYVKNQKRVYQQLNHSLKYHVEKSNQQGWLNHMIFERIRLATVVLNRKGLVEHYNPAAQKLLGHIDLGRPIEILQSSHQNWAEAAQEYDHFPIYIQGQHQKLQGKVIDLNPEEEGLWLVFLEPYQAQDFTQA